MLWACVGLGFIFFQKSRLIFLGLITREADEKEIAIIVSFCQMLFSWVLHLQFLGVLGGQNHYNSFIGLVSYQTTISLDINREVF